MESIRQYLELFEAHRQLIDSHSAAPLNRLRAEAFRELSSHPLPKKGSENYEDTDLPAMLAPDYGLNLADVPVDVGPACSFRCGVPNIGASVVTVENDTIRIPESLHSELPEGAEVTTLREMSGRDPEFMEKCYGRAAGLGNPIADLDTLLVRDGICIRIRKGVRLERPIQIVNILGAGMPLMAVRRILIVMEEDSEAKVLVCNHTKSEGIRFMDLGVAEMFAGRNSRLDYYEMEESTEETSRLNSLYLRQEEGSNVTIDSMTFYNGTTRNEFDCRFEGKEAGLRLLGLGIGDRSRNISVYSRIDHAVERCHSDELFKFSVDENAIADFTGRIHVAPGAIKTEAYQSCRNLVGSDKAKVNSKPQLEIYNDDVKCSHGSAVGQLDQMQLFYMRTRGLDEATATLLLKQAFMSDVIDAVGIPALRDRLHTIVEQRFSGERTSCQFSTECHDKQ